ncbi:MAG: radical SAM family heme chaperone HemW [Desulfobacterales bacterium]
MSSTSPPTAKAAHDRLAGIYLHCPFCVRKCPYCDFYSTTATSRQTHFQRAIITEISIRKAEHLTFDSLYFGGGTPSVIDPDFIEQVIELAHLNFDLRPDTEFTLEANPGTLSAGKFECYRRMGINRFNIGIQSFQSSNLEFLGRIHSAGEGYQAFDMARKAGFRNIGIDLIYGLPGQSSADWLADLKCALTLSPEHIAAYMLTYEKGTPLTRAKQQGRFIPLSDDALAELFETTVNHLETHGYHHYEVSNFARQADSQEDSFRSRHNLKYWNLSPYIGLGPAAHSYENGRRSWNTASLDSYISALDKGERPLAGQEQLNREQQLMEALYLGLRQTQGISLVGFKDQFGIDFSALYPESIEQLLAHGLIRFTETHCRLTLRGMLLLDSVVGLLVAGG